MKAPVQNQNFVISGRSPMSMRDLPVTGIVNFTKACLPIMTVSVSVSVSLNLLA